MSDNTQITYGTVPAQPEVGAFFTTRGSARLGPSTQIDANGDLGPTFPRTTQNFQASGIPITTHKTWSSVVWQFQYPETTDGPFTPPPQCSLTIPLEPWQANLIPTGLSLGYVTHDSLNMNATNALAGSNLSCTPYAAGQNLTLHGPQTGLWQSITGGPSWPGQIQITFDNFNATESLLDSYSDWMVTAQMQDQTDPTKAINIKMVEGSPYIYLEQAGTTNVSMKLDFVYNTTRLIYQNNNTFYFIHEADRTVYGLYIDPAATVQFYAAEYSGGPNLPFEQLFEGVSNPNNYISKISISSANFLSVAVLPDVLVSSFIVTTNPITPISGGTTYPTGTQLSDVPAYAVGTNQAIGTTNFYQSYFGNYGVYLDGLWSTHAGAHATGFFETTPAFEALLALYEQSAMAFIHKTELTYNYNQPDATVSVTYTTTTALKTNETPALSSAYINETLMVLKPHQYKYSTVDVLPDNIYASVHGRLQTILANSFTAVYDYPSFCPLLITETLTFSPEETQVLEEFLQLIVIDGQINFGASCIIDGRVIYDNSIPAAEGTCPTYASGKIMSRLAQIIPIANYMGRQDVSDVIENYLMDMLGRWFHSGPYSPVQNPFNPLVDDVNAQGCCVDNTTYLAENPGCPVRYFYYDEHWNTVIGYPADFGSNTELNDHHFHYGYFIHTVAIMALFGNPTTQTWAKSQDMVNLLIKDVANWDKADTSFPFLRIYNPYAGHSYANGHSFASGNNQESSSEAMNCWAGILLWGEATGNTTVRDLGAFLYTSEFYGIREYWLDIDGANFAKDIWFQDKGPTYNDANGTFAQYDYNRPTVGIVWGNKMDFLSFFGASANFIFGIQLLPWTPSSYYWGHFQQKLLAIFGTIYETNMQFIAQGILLNPAVTFNQFYFSIMWVDILTIAKSLFDPSNGPLFFDKLGNYLPQNPQYLTAESTEDHYIADTPDGTMWETDGYYNPAHCPLGFYQGSGSDTDATGVPGGFFVTHTQTGETGADFYFIENTSVPPGPENPPLVGEAGESKVHTYFYANLNAKLGAMTNAYYSDALFFKAFLKNDVVTFMIYNAETTEQTYHIYNRGTEALVMTMTVPAATSSSISSLTSDLFVSDATLAISDMITIQNPTSLPTGYLTQSYMLSLETLAPCNFAVTSGSLPEGLQLSQVGTIFGIPSAVGSYTFTVQTSYFLDTTQSTTQTFTLEIDEHTSSFSITTTSLPSGNAGEPYHAVVTASAPAFFEFVNDLSLSLDVSSEYGLEISPNGVITGILPTGVASITLTVIATAKYITATTFAEFTITINSVALKLHITSPSTLPNAAINHAYSYQLNYVIDGADSSSDLTNDTVVFSESGIPNGLSLSPDGLISGVPVSASATPFTFTVTAVLQNSSGTVIVTTYKSFHLLVESASITIITDAFPNAVINQAYNFSIQISVNPFITAEPYVVVSQGLPSGLIMSTQGVISGAPEISGTFSVIIQVYTDPEDTLIPSDLTAYASITLPLVVEPLTIITTTLPRGVINGQYSYQLQANVSSGVIFMQSPDTTDSLPNWMTLSPSGVLSGVPTAPGLYVVSVIADFVSDTLDHTLASAHTHLQIDILEINILPSTLPIGTVGANYFVQLSLSAPAINGTFFAVVFTDTNTDTETPTSESEISRLPPGVVLNGSGALSGIPTTPGSFYCVLGATFQIPSATGANVGADSEPTDQPPETDLDKQQPGVGYVNVSTVAPFTITINPIVPPPPPPPSNAWPAWQIAVVVIACVVGAVVIAIVIWAGVKYMASVKSVQAPKDPQDIEMDEK